MITGEIKNKLDRLWDAMWSNQMTNPWIDIQQVTYLIFIKMLDDNQIRVERKVNDMIANGIEASIDDFNPTFKSGNYVDDDRFSQCSQKKRRSYNWSFRNNRRGIYQQYAVLAIKYDTLFNKYSRQ